MTLSVREIAIRELKARTAADAKKRDELYTRIAELEAALQQIAQYRGVGKWQLQRIAEQALKQGGRAMGEITDDAAVAMAIAAQALAAKDERIAELEKDKARLEWMVTERANIGSAYDGGYHVFTNDYAEIPNKGHKDWRDAIDASVAQQSGEQDGD